MDGHELIKFKGRPQKSWKVKVVQGRTTRVTSINRTSEAGRRVGWLYPPIDSRDAYLKVNGVGAGGAWQCASASVSVCVLPAASARPDSSRVAIVSSALPTLPRPSAPPWASSRSNLPSPASRSCRTCTCTRYPFIQPCPSHGDWLPSQSRRRLGTSSTVCVRHVRINDVGDPCMEGQRRRGWTAIPLHFCEKGTRQGDSDLLLK